MRTDYTLSKLRLVRPSLFTDAVVVVESLTCPIITDLVNNSRIIQSDTLLPLGSAINRVPSKSFLFEVVVSGSKEVPALQTSRPSALRWD